jgi:hypothetical protein
MFLLRSHFYCFIQLPFGTTMILSVSPFSTHSFHLQEWMAGSVNLHCFYHHLFSLSTFLIMASIPVSLKPTPQSCPCHSSARRSSSPNYSVLVLKSTGKLPFNFLWQHLSMLVEGRFIQAVKAVRRDFFGGHMILLEWT